MAHKAALLLGFFAQQLVVLVPGALAGDGTATATGISRAFNPAISANGLMLAAYDSGHSEPTAMRNGDEHGHTHGVGTGSGLRLQEVEVRLTSFVDPYLKADLIVALPAGGSAELEEGFVTTQGLPGNLTLRAGKLLAEFGRHNLLHAHEYPFLDPPLVHEHLLSGEGLNEAGIGASVLLPVPWYGELTGQVLDGDNELFASRDDEDLLYLSHLKNAWEVSESATLELGGSYATGANHADERASLVGADLTVKWRPLRSARRRGLSWQTEYLWAEQGPGVQNEDGLYTLVQLQHSRRWWIQGRYDLLGVATGGNDSRLSGLVAFVPSEFSALRLQYSQLDEDGDIVHQLLLQLNFTVGSHPAHRY